MLIILKTRRSVLLASIGGSLKAENDLEYGCCDICSPTVSFGSHLNVIQPGTVRKRTCQRAVRKVGDNLKQK